MNLQAFLQTEELSIEEYEKALKKSKKENVISIALYHIERVRELETKENKLRKRIKELADLWKKYKLEMHVLTELKK